MKFDRFTGFLKEILKILVAYRVIKLAGRPVITEDRVWGGVR